MDPAYLRTFNARNQGASSAAEAGAPSSRPPGAPPMSSRGDLSDLIGRTRRIGGPPPQSNTVSRKDEQPDRQASEKPDTLPLRGEPGDRPAWDKRPSAPQPFVEKEPDYAALLDEDADLLVGLPNRASNARGGAVAARPASRGAAATRDADGEEGELDVDSARRSSSQLRSERDEHGRRDGSSSVGREGSVTSSSHARDRHRDSDRQRETDRDRHRGSERHRDEGRHDRHRRHRSRSRSRSRSRDGDRRHGSSRRRHDGEGDSHRDKDRERGRDRGSSVDGSGALDRDLRDKRASTAPSVGAGEDQDTAPPPPLPERGPAGNDDRFKDDDDEQSEANAARRRYGGDEGGEGGARGGSDGRGGSSSSRADARPQLQPGWPSLQPPTGPNPNRMAVGAQPAASAPPPPQQPPRPRLPALLREAVGSAARGILQREKQEEAQAAAAAAAAAAGSSRRRFADHDDDEEDEDSRRSSSGRGAGSSSGAVARPASDSFAAGGALGRGYRGADGGGVVSARALVADDYSGGDGADGAPASSASASGASPSARSDSLTGASPARVPASPGHGEGGAYSSSITAASSTWNFFHHGCRSVTAYRPLGKIDEGTYGEVFAAVDASTGVRYALKKVKMGKVTANEGFPITALRETNVLLALGWPVPHPNIVGVREMVVGSSLDKVYMVMELMEHDLKSVLAAMTGSFTQAEVKCLLRQLLAGISHLHTHWVVHRDIKPSNLLMDNAGRLCICDFGMARHYGEPLKAYTQPVVTLWYRAPELLLGQRVYGPPVDVFSVGCIFAELLTRKPLFRTEGGSDAEMLGLIFNLLGTPTSESWPGLTALPGAPAVAKMKPRPPQSLRSALGMVGGGGSFGGTTSVSDAGLELLRGMLALDPAQRISAADALGHRWFAESPPPADPRLLPSFPSSSDLKVAKQRTARAATPPPPRGSTS